MPGVIREHQHVVTDPSVTTIPLSETEGEISAHEAAADPHPGYTTAAELATGLGTKEATQTAASQAEAEAGSETAVRKWSPLRIAQAIASLATGGGWPLTDDVDADGHTIQNLADPVDDGDAVPKSYADGLAGGAVGVAAVTLTSAQIRALNATPVTLNAPAPGAGKMYLVLGAMLQFVDGAVPYAWPSNSRIEVGPREMVDQDYSNWETPSGGPGHVFGGDNAYAFQPNASNRFPTALGDNEPLAVGNPGNELNGGSIIAATVASGGSGYAPGDQFIVTDGLGVNAATCEVDTVDGGGAVLTFHVVSGGTPGSVYSASFGSPYLTVKTGGGGDDALTITVTSTASGDGTMTVTVLYAVVDLA